MIHDFQLNLENLVRQDTENVELMGNKIRVEYRLHRDEFRDPNDPEGSGKMLWCLHLPQINSSYVDESEEKVFEALHEFFTEDFIRYQAVRLNEERDKREENK